MEKREEKIIDLREAQGVDPNMLGQHDSVMAALATHYENSGYEVHKLWVANLEDGTTGMFDVWVPELNRIVEVESADTIMTLDPHRYEPWIAAGYEIWVMAPVDKMNVTQRRLGKVVDRILPWSLHGPKVVFEELAAH